jgi:hypothetical protein
MIFNSKQLEELENIHDSTGAFEEEADDEGGFDDVGEAAMDWRRGIIEEAAESVKRAKTRPVESSIQYPVHSLLFDREARRFGRVQKSVPGYLKIVYLSGGDREYGTLDVNAYLREYGAQKRVSEMSEQLGMADVDVAVELERMGITPLEEPEPTPEELAAAPTAAAPTPRTPKPPPIPKTKKPKFEEEEVEEEEVLADDAEEVDDVDDVIDDDVLALGDDDEAPQNGKKGAKPAGKAPPPGKGAPPAKMKGKEPPPPMKGAAKPALAKPAIAAKPAGKPVVDKKAEAKKPAPPPTKNEKKPAGPQPKQAPAKQQAPAKAEPAKKGASGKGVNPIDDPNGYIKTNFQTMSNRELARLTGLSEHTIRRKLGEWGMKRKKEE